MQSSPSIESFRSMMFKKAGKPHLADIPISDLYYKYKQKLEDQMELNQKVKDDLRLEQYMGANYKRQTSPEARSLSSYPSDAFAGLHRMDDVNAQRSARAALVDERKRRKNHRMPATTTASNIMGGAGELPEEENDPIILAMADMVGERLAEGYARTAKAGNPQGVPAQEAMDYVYEIIQDPDFVHNPISQRDQNLGLWLHNEIIKKLVKLDLADDRAWESASKRGEVWNSDKSQLLQHNYMKDGVTIRKYVQANMDEIFNLALVAGQHYLKQMQNGRGRKGNINLSNEQIAGFADATEKASQEYNIANPQNPYAKVRFSRDAYINPSVTEGKALYDIGGNYNRDNATFYNLNRQYPMIDAGVLTVADQTALYNVSEYVKKALLDGRGNDIRQLISEGIKELQASNPGLFNDSAMRNLIKRGTLSVRNVLSRVIYGSERNRKEGLLGQGMSYDDIVKLIGDTEGSRPNPGSYGTEERDATTVRQMGMVKPLKGKLAEKENEILTVQAQPNTKGKQAKLEQLFAERDRLKGDIARLEQNLGETKIPAKPSIEERSPFRQDFDAYSRKETGHINWIPTPMGGQGYGGGEGPGPQHKYRELEDEVDYYIKGLDKIFRMDEAYAGNQYESLLRNVRRTISEMDDKETSARLLKEIDTNGKEGVKNVITELLRSPKYTATLSRKDGSTFASPDVMYQIGQQVKAYANKVNPILEKLNSENFAGGQSRVLSEGLSTEVAPRDHGKPGEWQSETGSGPTIEEVDYANRFSDAMTNARVGGNPAEADRDQQQIRAQRIVNPNEYRRASQARAEMGRQSTTEDYGKGQTPIDAFNQGIEEQKKIQENTKDTRTAAEEGAVSRAIANEANVRTANEMYEQLGKVTGSKRTQLINRFNKQNPEAFRILKEPSRL